MRGSIPCSITCTGWPRRSLGLAWRRFSGRRTTLGFAPLSVLVAGRHVLLAGRLCNGCGCRTGPSASVGWPWGSISAAICRCSSACRGSAFTLLRLPVILVAPVVYPGMELAQAHLLSGMTMGCLEHSQYRWTTLIQISDLTGCYGVTFLVMFVAACLARMLPCGPRRRALWPLLPAAVPPVCANGAFSAWSMATPPAGSAGKNFRCFQPRFNARSTSVGVVAPGKNGRFRTRAAFKTDSFRPGDTPNCAPASMAWRTCSAESKVPARWPVLGNLPDGCV